MPDFLANNPPELDTRDEVREAVREAGGDPMDTYKESKATYGWSILNSWEDDPPESRSDADVFAAEAELVATSLTEDHGVDIDDWPDVPNAPEWYDG